MLEKDREEGRGDILHRWLGRWCRSSKVLMRRWRPLVGGRRRESSSLGLRISQPGRRAATAWVSDLEGEEQVMWYARFH